MIDGLRGAYARLRTVPALGALATRLVWAAKGALGQPLAAASATIAPAPLRPRSTAPPAFDVRLAIVLTAVQVLAERVAMLEQAPSCRPADPAGCEAFPSSVTVIVSTLDRAGWLDRALSALAYQRHQGFEVIVVAGPCSDATEQVLARHAERIRPAVCSSANLAASRNIGLRMARGDVAAFLDDDATPEPDWLERLLEPFGDPQVGGVGGYIRDHTGLGWQCRVVAADRFGRSAEVSEIERARLDAPGPQAERYLSLTGTNSAFRRRALLDIGGFDEAYAYFLDETDVCLRLTQAGWRLAVAPQAEVHHAYAPSAQRRADRAPLSLLACARSTAYFAFRNAAPRHGAAAAADHLAAYAQALHTDTLWRHDHGVVTQSDATRLLAEVETGVREGVGAALGAPRRLLPDHVSVSVGVRMGAPPVIRPSADRLRLCLLSQTYPHPQDVGAPPGGVAVWTQALAQAMAAAGHEVTVVSRACGAEPPNAQFSAEDGAGLWLHRISPRPDGRGPHDALLDRLPASIARPALAAAQEVRRVGARRRFDLVMGPLWDLEPAALLGRCETPVAVSLHTACAQMGEFKPEWNVAYRRDHVDKVIAGERALLARAQHVVANSCATARDIAAALGLPDLPERAVVIAHGLPDLSHGVRPAAREGGLEVLFVGRLELRKGVDVLLAAAPDLLARHPEMRLRLVGEEVGGGGRAALVRGVPRAPCGRVVARPDQLRGSAAAFGAARPLRRLRPGGRPVAV